MSTQFVFWNQVSDSLCRFQQKIQEVMCRISTPTWSPYNAGFCFLIASLSRLFNELRLLTRIMKAQFASYCKRKIIVWRGSLSTNAGTMPLHVWTILNDFRFCSQHKKILISWNRERQKISAGNRENEKNKQGQLSAQRSPSMLRSTWGVCPRQQAAQFQGARPKEPLKTSLSIFAGLTANPNPPMVLTTD